MIRCIHCKTAKEDKYFCIWRRKWTTETGERKVYTGRGSTCNRCKYLKSKEHAQTRFAKQLEAGSKV